MSLSFGFAFPAWRSINGSAPPMPGFPFIVLSSDDTPYIVNNGVADSDGANYNVIDVVLDSNGNSYIPI